MADDWVLVATSRVEAGVNLSFRTAFRGRFSVASLIQVSGRANRDGEYDAVGGAEVYDFSITATEIPSHPAAARSAPILGEMLARGLFSSPDTLPADIVSRAMAYEIRDEGGLEEARELLKAERTRDYPRVASINRVIGTDTRLIVVDPALTERLKFNDGLRFRDVLEGSVQVRSRRNCLVGVPAYPNHPEISFWPYAYDPDFLGYMAGVLDCDDIAVRGWELS